MSSRDRILSSIRQSLPEPEALPDLELPRDGATGDTLERFKTALEGAAASWVVTTAQEIEGIIRERFPEAKTIATAAPQRFSGDRVISGAASPDDLARVDVCVCEGTLGVAENGAVWVTESQMGHRAAPFLSQHLVLLLEADRLVDTMREAYGRIRIDQEGFAAWIAGPSKTADIEQSLVIGAHGPRSVLVLLLVG